MLIPPKASTSFNYIIVPLTRLTRRANKSITELLKIRCKEEATQFAKQQESDRLTTNKSFTFRPKRQKDSRVHHSSVHFILLKSISLWHDTAKRQKDHFAEGQKLRNSLANEQTTSSEGFCGDPTRQIVHQMKMFANWWGSGSPSSGPSNYIVSNIVTQRRGVEIKEIPRWCLPTISQR